MADSGLMRTSQPVRDLGGQREETLVRKRTLREQIAQGLSVDELHGNEGDGVLPPDVMDRDDIRVVESRGGASFLLEAEETFTIDREFLGQDLDRDLAGELGVARAIDLAHSSSAERRENLVDTEPGA